MQGDEWSTKHAQIIQITWWDHLRLGFNMSILCSGWKLNAWWNSSTTQKKKKILILIDCASTKEGKACGVHSIQYIKPRTHISTVWYTLCFCLVRALDACVAAYIRSEIYFKENYKQTRAEIRMKWPKKMFKSRSSNPGYIKKGYLLESHSSKLSSIFIPIYVMLNISAEKCQFDWFSSAKALPKFPVCLKVSY